MKRMLVVCGMVLLLVGPIAAGGQAEGGKKAGKTVIGAAIQGNESTFMQFVVAGMYKYAAEHPDAVELKVVYADNQADKQITQVERLVGSGVAAIILNPVSVVASSPAVDVAREAKVPILTVNTKVENQDKASAYVGSDDVEAGELQMQRLIDQIGGKGNVAIIQAVIGHSAQIGRDKGYDNILAKYPDVKVIYRQPADWVTDKAQRLTENWLQRGQRIDAIATEVDTMAIGAVFAYEERGIPIPPIGGMDAIDQALEMIGDGRMDDTIWQDGVGQGYHSVRLAMDLAQGKSVSDVILPFEVITKENLPTYLEKVKERNALAKKYF